MAERILFFFSAIGVFNALLLAIYLFFSNAQKSLENRLFSLLILLLVIRVGVSCFHFFDTVPRDAIKLGLVANFLLGPAMFFIIKNSSGSGKHVERSYLLHLGIWILIFIPIWIFFDFQTWNWKIRYVVHIGLTLYLGYVAFNWRSSILKFLKSETVPLKIEKGIITYLALVTICSGFAISLFTSYILGPIVFSVIFYLVVGYLLLTKRKAKTQTLPKTINQSEFIKLSQRLNELMEQEKPYRNPDLSLESLAVRLSISRHMLSQLLNDYLSNSFYQYINHYRIEDACQILRDNKSFSVEAIGYEVGFNSRSSFFSSFRKLKGTTPSKFREAFESV